MHAIIHPAASAEGTLKAMALEARFEVATDGEAAGFPTASVPKLFMSNDCRFNCAYCTCRATRDVGRYCHEPRALARLAAQAGRANGRGVFVTSAVYRSPDETQERIVAALRALREELGYRGYVHAKVMPGADPGLIALTGRYADRMSVNIEVANSAGYARLARQKSRGTILGPMEAIHRQIVAARAERRPFAASQSTQLMAGSLGEDDRAILTLSGALYRRYALKRVYYTAFQYRHRAAGYDLPEVSTPAWRVGRLYQADRLMQLYGFTADELAPEGAPNLDPALDPKTAWALRHPERFPVEVNRADYETLLRVPGVGPTWARRILRARRLAPLSWAGLRALGLPLGRCRYFLCCGGRGDGLGLLDRPDLLALRLGAGFQQTLELP